jgi:hypothetical protein
MSDIGQRISDMGLRNKALLAPWLALMLACDDGIDPVNLNGTWSGNLTLTVAGAPQNTPLTLMLTQSGSTASGNLTSPSREFTVSAVLNGRTLYTTATPEINFVDDCVQHSMNIVFDVSGSAMSAISAGGVHCTGIMTGGHSSTEPITAASGTLTRN